jgi:predicted transposase/invertase (TIGR01784 family)
VKQPRAEDAIIVPEILPPSDDGVFKTLLTHPDAKPVLCDIIASVLDIPVTDAVVRNSELPISGIREKCERFDVNCRTEDSRQIDVEMQAEPATGDSAATGHENLKKRAIYYLCDLHASQEGRGTHYQNLMQSFQITFCGFTVFSRRRDFMAKFAFRSEDGETLSDAVGIVFVELSKLKSAMKKPVKEMTSSEMWAVFFGHANESKHKKLLREMIDAKEEIKLASELLMNISRDEKERAHYRSRKMFLMDMEHSMAVARDEGLEKGIEQGIEKGIKQGKEEGLTEVAKNAFAMGLSVDQIEKLTGLSRAETESLCGRRDLSGAGDA